MQSQLIKDFSDISLLDIALVGGKNASLGEMIRNLNQQDIKVPNGFAITTEAYRAFIKENNLHEVIENNIKGLDVCNISALKNASQNIKQAIKAAKFSSAMTHEIKEKYQALKKEQDDFLVAVRSSASAEDLPGASFAGQQDTYLNVKNFEELLERCVDVYASLFGERAIAYREHNHFDHSQVYISVGIQEMVMSHKSGVMFTIDPESGFERAIFINASYGLGEMVVSGSVNPDEFLVYKPAIKENRLVVLNKKLGSKEKQLLLHGETAVDKEKQDQFSLSNEDIFYLAQCAVKIEAHYQRPMDIEWAKGMNGQIYILQARPETIHSNHNKHSFSYSLLEEGEIIAQGRAVGKSVGQGKARILKSIDDAYDFKPGEVLVTDMTDPNWEPIMSKASAIVTNKGGRTCHAAIIARELNIAAIVGCDDATHRIKDHSDITVSCLSGDTGLVYEGLLKTKKTPQKISDKKSQVPLMLIAANPSKALGYNKLPHQGIGLARLEFIIANTIGIHPNAILQFDTMPHDIKEKIKAKSKPFTNLTEFYTHSLRDGISTLAAVASPHPIIVRMSDFKTNEYEELIGGSLFEQKENNPMLGFRGACRYTSPQFSDAFALECEAIKMARNDNGFKNIKVMLPFVRTLEEAKNISELLARNGLKRGQDGLEVIMMCEVPSNVILADKFLEYFDGFSIGSNDLTQLTLGVDRDSHLVAKSFDEADPAMKEMFKQAILACKRLNKYVGICGQGPSDNLDLAYYLKNLGIDTISLTPDTIMYVNDLLAE